jgi:chorismate mutase
MITDPNPTLERLDQALTELQAGRLDTRQFVALARDQPELLARLPPRYAEVLNGLLDRLESSALFDAESCSFSQRDLTDSMRLWLQKATALLQA